MTRSRSITFLAGAAVVLLAAAALAGCGSGGGGASAPAAPPKTTNGQPATLGVANDSNLGEILVDSQARTLYLFLKDSGTTSACTDACAAAWPPLRASGKPTLGRGANAPLLGTTTRSDGNPQVTYHGHPLYLYAGDQKPGDTNGQGLTQFGAGWFALSPAGDQVSGQGSGSGAGYNFG